VVLRTMVVSVRMLVIGVLRVLRVAVLVGVVLDYAARLMVTLAVRMRMRILVADMARIAGVAVFVVRVLRQRLGHGDPFVCGAAPLASTHLCEHTRMYVDSEADDDQVLMAVEVFRLLADATRVRLLRALAGSAELSVNDLSEAVGKRPGAVSQHLAKLRMARLVTTRREGNQIMYRVANDHVSQLVADALRHSEHLGPGIPLHHRAEPES
jgi:DNA-binding transcriptional ArsR family regulator